MIKSIEICIRKFETTWGWKIKNLRLLKKNDIKCFLIFEYKLNQLCTDLIGIILK